MKTFAELNKDDTIYYYTKLDWKGPSDIKSHKLIHPPCLREWTPIIEVDFYYENETYGNYYETIELSTDDVKDTVIIDKGCDNITIKVFMTLEDAQNDRIEYINRLIKSHEESINKLKQMI
jgi:hypothetical protein